MIAETLNGIGYYAGKRIFNLTLYNRRGEKIEYNIPENLNKGDHDGGDVRLLDMLLRGYEEDPLGQIADSHEGAMSIMIGIAANVSMKEGRQVKISELMNR